MSIRNKLITAMLSVAFVTLLLSGLIIYNHSKKVLFSTIENHLHEIAAVQLSRIDAVVKGYIDVMEMMAARPKLKAAIAQYDQTTDIEDVKFMKETIRQIRESIPAFHEVSIVDKDRKAIISSNESNIGEEINENLLSFEGDKGCGYVDVFKGDDTLPDLRFACNLIFDNHTVGYITAVAHGGFLYEVTGDYTNLGKTGETVVAKKDDDGNALFVVPVRFDANAAFNRRVSKDNISILITQALLKRNKLFREYLDYSGVAVYGVTGYLDKYGWGIVVKMSKAEMMEPLVQLRNILIYSYIFIMGILTIVAFVISGYITAPLSKLTNMARQVGKGIFSQKISHASTDETGVLVAVFNQMTEMLAVRDEELAKHRESLETLVSHRTVELTKINEQLESEVDVRKSMTLRLMEINNQLNSLVSAIPDMVIFKDSQKRFLLVNKAFEEITNIEKEAVIGKRVDDIFPPEVAAIYNQEDDSAIKMRATVRDEKKLTKSDKDIYLETINAPIYDNYGVLIGIVVIGRDITQRVELENELMKRNETLEDMVKLRTEKLVQFNRTLIEEVQQRKEMEGQLAREKHLSDTIINTLPGIFCLVDESGRLMLWNKNMELMTNHPSERMSETDIFDFFPVDADEAAKREIDNIMINKKGAFESHLRGKQTEIYFVGSVVELDNASYLTLIGIDITYRKQVEAELMLSRERLRLNAIHLQNTIEEDRRKIARELHDDMSQALTVLKIEISGIAKSSGVTLSTSDKIKNCTGIVDDIIDNMHSLVMQLRPTLLDDFGLIPAIQWHISDLQRRTGMVFEFDAEIGDKSNLEALDRGYAVILYRVFQESVTNVLRHAEAKNVKIRLHDAGESIVMEVEDDGKGIDESQMFEFKSLGITGMKERVSMVGGKFYIDKALSGTGTKITAHIPINRRDERYD